MTTRSLSLFLFFLPALTVSAVTPTDSLLSVLDAEISRSEGYIEQREQRIASQKAVYQRTPTATNAYFVAELYAPYQCDSALLYYNYATALCTDSIPAAIATGLRNCRNRMYGQESVYTPQYTQGTPAENTHDYAIFAYNQAQHYLYAGQDSLYAEWLVRSAIADVRDGITDNASCWMLADYIYQNGNGNIARAYRYIQYALDNASIFNARLRYVQINRLSKIINQAREEEQQAEAHRLYLLLGCLSALLLTAIVLSIIAFRQNRRLQLLNRQMVQTNQSLEQANRIKEHYISLYLETYAKCLHRMAKNAPKTRGCTPDAFLDQEMPLFYQQFDSAFLTIFPNFVDEFNRLLRPENQIIPDKKGTLNTELRIFALIRLGIDSSTRIAELLCYSANTIYNYRARVKNYAAGNRDDFEQAVKRINN